MSEYQRLQPKAPVNEEDHRRKVRGLLTAIAVFTAIVAAAVVVNAIVSFVYYSQFI